MADLEIVSHARGEMKRDSITEADIHVVVEDYDDMVNRHDGRTEYVRIMDDGRRIMVIIEANGFEVITVFWDRRGSRRSGRR